AERASLMVFDEVSNELVVRAAVGLSEETAAVSRMRLGEGISGAVLESAMPLMVANIDHTSVKPAPHERNYRTKSFISYPITIGGRRIGVLNVTDKTGGGAYDEVDLSLLEIIGPQIAVALERAEWQERATEFQLMSITDPLTSLPNRRYLEERLTEELNRSKRYEYPMSFLMIDIDDFKSYNDLNGHQAGDLALQITAHCLKAALRSADVASRYGGEEFCIVLPQTPINEAEVIAERIRQRVHSTTFPHGKTQPLGAVTISIGVSTFGKHIDTAERVIAAADRALYSAKNQGKNRVELYRENLTRD
ncbi:MAG: diguanylate cyclase, partial [Pyrinomonadaceae bacterium]